MIKIKHKKTYKFAFYSALLIAFFALLLMFGLHQLFFATHHINLIPLLLFISILFLFTFIVIQFRVERFIYKRIQKIYKEVAVLTESDLDKNTITTNMENLSKNVKLFVTDKTKEIKSLKEREDFRREFLGNIAHELKTPLFTIQSYVLTLMEGAINDNEVNVKYLERANNGIERLNHIVKDLDLIAKLEKGKLNLNYSNFNIILLIEEVFDLLEINAKKRNIQLVFDKIYDAKILVNADKDRIQQVLLNLITNAIYYSNKDAIVKIKIKAYKKNKISIAITDKGEGISPENLIRVFERFYRTEKSRTRNQGGSGLGLSIVKHIIEAHNQTVFVESTVNVGSTFSFSLDLA